jgi:SSS family solute:Na+ symporter
MFAAIVGAIVSSLASMLNSASTIVTVDVYKRLLRPGATQATMVWIGRGLTLLFVILGCWIAPNLDDPRFGGIFNFIQESQGYIWPGVVAAFLFGIVVKRAPAAVGVVALAGGPLLYGLFQQLAKIVEARYGLHVHFLLQVLLAFLILCGILGVMTAVAPLRQPRTLPERPEMNVPTSPVVKWAGAIVIAAVAVFYLLFW